MKEIGSEFWIDENFHNLESAYFPEYLSFGKDRKLLFSGRTAIDFVLQDIKKKINTVYIPSYCCSSMLQPFIDRNIDIEYYDMKIDSHGINYIIDFQKEVDLFFAISYFGFSQSNMDTVITKYREKEIIVIEDITHRLLSQSNYSEAADYWIASIRKWIPIPSGGIAIKSTGLFLEQTITPPPNTVINNKIKAMKQKSKYMNTFFYQKKSAEKVKKDFSQRYSKFANELNLDYKNYAIDKKSELILLAADINKIKKKRIENAQFLYNELKDCVKLKFLFKKLDCQMDCPLFVPIVIEDFYRDNLKRLLIENEIYCPSHWPNPDPEKLTVYKNPIYNQELSIICDQRYELKDMQRIVKVIKEFEMGHA